LFFLNVLTTQSQQALRLLSEEPTEIFLSEFQRQVWIFANAHETFSRKEIIEATGLNPRTVDHSLRKLVDMNKIERFGEGRATQYQMV